MGYSYTTEAKQIEGTTSRADSYTLQEVHRVSQTAKQSTTELGRAKILVFMVHQAHKLQEKVAYMRVLQRKTQQ